MLKVVQEYHGHCNTLTLGLPIFLDPTETLLFAGIDAFLLSSYKFVMAKNVIKNLPSSLFSLCFLAGEDSLTRVWSVSTGEMVCTIPYPVDENTNISAIPALNYSDEWGGPGGPAGLLYGTNEVIRWYGM